MARTESGLGPPIKPPVGIRLAEFDQFYCFDRGSCQPYFPSNLGPEALLAQSNNFTIRCPFSGATVRVTKKRLSSNPNDPTFYLHYECSSCEIVRDNVPK